MASLNEMNKRNGDRNRDGEEDKVKIYTYSLRNRYVE